jgi:hypothetical protein
LIVLSWFAKWCLAFTAISPAFGSAAITAIFVHDNWQWGIAWTVTGLVTVAIAGLLIRFAKNHVQTSSMHVNDVEPADQRVLEFLIAYLLPVFSSANLPNLAGSIILSSYSLLIVLLIVANGNMFQFNPVLSMMVTVHGPESPENTVFSRNLKNASMNFVVHSQDSASRVLQQSFRTSKISGKLIFRVFAISCMATL